MQIVLQVSEEPTTLRKESDALLDNDRFFDFCMRNPDMRIERSAEGEVIVMPPAGGESGDQNGEITAQLRIWAKKDGRGRAFDSSTGFTLPNAAIRSPDASWVRNPRLEKLSKKQKRGFLPLCPDFVIELKSRSDELKALKIKMDEWMENGAELGWLIDTDRRTVMIYRQGREPERLVNPDEIAGEGPVEGFRLELAEIWAGI
jgi:Uma2 family endonuclease